MVGRVIARSTYSMCGSAGPKGDAPHRLHRRRAAAIANLSPAPPLLLPGRDAPAEKPKQLAAQIRSITERARYEKS